MINRLGLNVQMPEYPTPKILRTLGHSDHKNQTSPQTLWPALALYMRDESDLQGKGNIWMLPIQISILICDAAWIIITPCSFVGQRRSGPTTEPGFSQGFTWLSLGFLPLSHLACLVGDTWYANNIIDLT